VKLIFVGPRSLVDLLVGRAEHQAVLLDGGEWLCVADVHDSELQAQIEKAGEAEILPHPGSRRSVGAGTVGRLRVPGISPDDGTHDAVAKVVEDRGMPTLLQLLSRGH